MWFLIYCIIFQLARWLVWYGGICGSFNSNVPSYNGNINCCTGNSNSFRRSFAEGRCQNKNNHGHRSIYVARGISLDYKRKDRSQLQQYGLDFYHQELLFAITIQHHVFDVINVSSKSCTSTKRSKLKQDK